MNFKLTVEGSHSLGSSVHRSTLERLLHHPYSLYFSCCFSGDAALQRFLPALCGKHSLRSHPHAGDSAPTSPARAVDAEVPCCPQSQPSPVSLLSTILPWDCSTASEVLASAFSTPRLCRPLPVTRIRSFLYFT